MPDHTDADAVNYTYRYPDLVAFSTADPDVESYAAPDAEHPPDAGGDSSAFALAHRDSDNPDAECNADAEYHAAAAAVAIGDAAPECYSDPGDLRAG